MPKSVSLEFNEKVLEIHGREISQLSLINPKGEKIHLGNMQAVGRKLNRFIPDQVFISGKYQVIYRVVSADGHVVSGNYKFTLALRAKK